MKNGYDTVEYTLSSGDLLELLDMEETDKNMKVTVREADIPALADRIIEEQGADGREAKYGKCRETRDYVYLKAADNGFVLDRESLRSVKWLPADEAILEEIEGLL